MGQGFIPAARQRVRVHGRTGVYFVLAVDRESELAYVVRVNNDMDGDSGVETVSFVQLARPEATPGDELLESVAD